MASLRKIQVLLAAPKSIMGSSLQTFLRTMVEVDISGIVNKPDCIQIALSKQLPDILLLDADMIDQLPGQSIETILVNIHTVYTKICIIVLVNSFAQQSAALNAKSDHVLIKGELGDQLREAIRAYPVWSMRFQDTIIAGETSNKG